jgi:very-short-patch-repair endonuclease
MRGVYAEGPDAPGPLDRARAHVLVSGCPARGALAAELHHLEGLYTVAAVPTRRPPLSDRVVTIEGVRCVDALQTLVDLAETMDDDRWEQALESALRKRLIKISDLEAALPDLGRARTPGTARIRRVLARRPQGAPPTESLLETLMVQLVRRAGLPDPVRQREIYDEDGSFVARVDLCWPDVGLFVELDGQHHKSQPLYDARRETAVVAATGWLVGRFTWHEVVAARNATIRRLTALFDRSRRRPITAS